MKIAQSAVQGIGMSTKEIRGSWMNTQNYAFAVSLLFTRATKRPREPLKRIPLSKSNGASLAVNVFRSTGEIHAASAPKDLKWFVKAGRCGTGRRRPPQMCAPWKRLCAQFEKANEDAG